MISFLSNIFYFALTIILFPTSLIVIFNFVLFASSQSIKEHVSTDEDVITPVLFDMGLILAFMIVHTLLACQSWKKFLICCFDKKIERLAYVGVTILLLQTLMNFWKEIPLQPIWLVDIKDRWLLSFMCTIIHCLAWCVMFGETIIMDMAELFGLKQFYYSFFGYGDPMAYKSVELVKLYQHMRHPGTIMLMLILWIHPIMTVSRMVLAIGFTLYLTLGFSVTFADYEYARQQWDKKLL